MYLVLKFILWIIFGYIRKCVVEIWFRIFFLGVVFCVLIKVEEKYEILMKKFFLYWFID